MKADINKFLALRNALLQERAQIQARLVAVNRALGDGAASLPEVAAAPGRRTFSAATKAKMAAAQKARWAKLKGGATAATAAVKKPKRKLSAAGRAAIVAAAKARWARVKAGK